MDYYRFFIVQIFFLACLSAYTFCFNAQLSSESMINILNTENIIPHAYHTTNSGNNAFSLSFAKALISKNSSTDYSLSILVESTLNHVESTKKMALLRLLKTPMQKVEHRSTAVLGTTKFPSSITPPLISKKQTSPRTHHFSNSSSTDRKKQAQDFAPDSSLLAHCHTRFFQEDLFLTRLM